VESVQGVSGSFPSTKEPLEIISKPANIHFRSLYILEKISRELHHMTTWPRGLLRQQRRFLDLKAPGHHAGPLLGLVAKDLYM